MAIVIVAALDCRRSSENVVPNVVPDDRRNGLPVYGSGLTASGSRGVTTGTAAKNKKALEAVDAVSKAANQ
jgi:hypothetical protein